MNCPQCRQPLTQVDRFWICPAHGQVSPEKPSGRLRIFLSYGHDGKEELVRRIKADLEKRGHDVCFDKSEIKFGDEWRRSITDGAMASHRVLSFLSKHSTRDPGVGKSAFAAQLTHTRRDTVIAIQFCEWDKPDHHNAQRVVRSLAFQLATRHPDYRKLLLTLPDIKGLGPFPTDKTGLVGLVATA